MRDIFERYGLVEPLPEIQAAERQTIPSQLMSFSGGGRTKKAPDPRKLRRDWRQLIRASETPVFSRAISLIVDKVSSLDWVVGPKPEFADNSDDYLEEIAIVSSVLNNPNIEDGDWPTFARQIIEDQLVFDSGVWEYVEKPTPAPYPNDILAIVPVPGWSIERVVEWSGEAKDYRWVQKGGRDVVPLLDSQIEMIMTRKRSSVSYGLSPVEVAIGLMDAYLNLGSYQADVASEAYPAFMLSLGENTDQAQIDQMRTYWDNAMRGRARPGMFGGFADAKSLQTKAITDDGLYLKYAEQLLRCVAFVFKLKAQDFNIERDVNKSQGVISQAASIEESIRPYAIALANRVTRRLIPRIAAITGNVKILDLDFGYSNIDPWDEMEQTNLTVVQWEADLISRGESREKLGQPPLDDGTDDMFHTEYVSQYGPAVGDTAPIDVSNDSTNKSASSADPRVSRLAQLLNAARARMRAGKKKASRR